jgi:3-phosphoshikimate 1-carboxyvinyltransferase
MKIRQARGINGAITLSGDKSLSHRAAMIAAMARGPSRLANFSNSQDCASTLACLHQIGVSISRDGNRVQIIGQGLNGFAKPANVLDCGNSGSTMRMLAGLLAGQEFASQLTGDESLRSRPMRRIIEPLEMMGAQIDAVHGKPPLRLFPCGPLRPIRYELPVASAQVKSCILFAGLYAHGRTSVIEPQGTRDHTERMLRWYNAPVETSEGINGAAEISVTGQSDFNGRDTNIPGDISSAAFMIAAAALLPGSDLVVKAVGLNPTRTQLLSELQSLGASIKVDEVHEDCNEPVGNVYVKGGLNPPSKQQGANKVSGKLIPQLIDELPLLAVVGTQVSGGIEIREAAELRVKESDRLAATAQNLRAMGADVEEYPDGLAVSGPTRLRGALLDSHGDHRIALAFSVAALIAEGESEIEGASCVAVSFPGFFELLETLVVR